MYALYGHPGYFKFKRKHQQYGPCFQTVFPFLMTIENMTKLKTSDCESWQYLEENFSIIKSKILFVGIGSDHALEQENKVMKVAGGVIGLTQNQAALNRFCLSAPILSSLTQQFLEKNNGDVYNRKHHYDISENS